MSLSTYLWGIRLFTLLAFSAWLGIVLVIDPTRAGAAGIALFFGSLFAVALGVFTLFVTWTYRKGLGETGAAHHLGGAFRQAFLLACSIEGIAGLQFFGVLYWWNGLLLLAALLLIEFSIRHLWDGRNN